MQNQADVNSKFDSNQPNPMQLSTVDLEQSNPMMQRRDLLLEATAKAAKVLLTLEGLDEAINTALTIFGEGIGCDFICILENVCEPSSVLPTYCNFLYEWAAPGLSPLTVIFGSTRLPAEMMGTAILEQYFLEGDGFGGLLEDWMSLCEAYLPPLRFNQPIQFPFA